MSKLLMLVKHENVKFEDATVYLSGHSYHRCEFNRCTLVLTDLNYHFADCKGEGNAFRLELTISCRTQWEQMVAPDGILTGLAKGLMLQPANMRRVGPAPIVFEDGQGNVQAIGCEKCACFPCVCTKPDDDQ